MRHKRGAHEGTLGRRSRLITSSYITDPAAIENAFNYGLGAVPNHDCWLVNPLPSSTYQPVFSGGKGLFTSISGVTCALYSAALLVGDFDIQIEFSDYAPSGTVYTAQIGGYFGGATNVNARIWEYSGTRIYSTGLGGSNYGSVNASGVTSGGLRLIRSGNSWTSMYLNAGNWTNIDAGRSSAQTYWGRLGIELYTNSGTSVVKFFNLKFNLAQFGQSDKIVY